MRLDQPHQPFVDLLPDLGRHHGFQRCSGHFEREVARPLMAGIDDRHLGGGGAVRPGAH